MQEERIARLFAEPADLDRPQFVVTLDGVEPKRKKITVSEYLDRQKPPVEFVVTVPDKYEQVAESTLLREENFTEADVCLCVSAAIRTLPPHLAAAFTVSDYLWPRPVAVNEAKGWTYGIIGFDPFVPPPVRQPPYYRLKNNFVVPPPASARQLEHWQKSWRRLERIVLYDIREYLRIMIRAIMIEFARVKLNLKSA